MITYKGRPIRTYICWLTLRNICHIYYAHVAIYVIYMSKYMSYMINWFLYKCIYGITYKGVWTYILTYITKYMSYITHTWQYMSIYVTYMHHICTFRMGTKRCSMFIFYFQRGYILSLTYPYLIFFLKFTESYCNNEYTQWAINFLLESNNEIGTLCRGA